MNLDNLELSCRNFKEFSERLSEIIEGIPDINTRIKLCREMSEHYKHLAQLDGIRDDARKLQDYFYQAALGYGYKLSSQKNN